MRMPLSPVEAASFTLLKEQLVEVLSTLTPREEKVLQLRFGIEDGRTRTLEEVGKEFHVTRERIRQIEAKALRKLRHPSPLQEAEGLPELSVYKMQNRRVPFGTRRFSYFSFGSLSLITSVPEIYFFFSDTSASIWGLARWTV